MNHQGMKMSLFRILVTATVCLTLISCAKGSSQRTSEESLLLGNSVFNPGDKAPGIELEPQSSNTATEQSQSAELASLSVFSLSTKASDGGYIPGGQPGFSGGSDSGSIPQAGTVVTSTTIPAANVPIANPGGGSSSSAGNSASTGGSSGTNNAGSTDLTQGGGASSGSTSTISSGTIGGGTDNGSIPNSGATGGIDNGSLPGSGNSSGPIASTGSGGSVTDSTNPPGSVQPPDSTATTNPSVVEGGGNSNSGSTSGSANDTGIISSGGTQPGTDNGGIPTSGGNQGVDNGNTGTTLPPVADNGSGSETGASTGSTTGTQTGTDNGGIPTSGGNQAGDNGNTGTTLPPVADNGSTSQTGGSGGESPVLLCHFPPGNVGNSVTIVVSPSAVPAHFAHGDKMGECPINSNNNSSNNPSNNEHNDSCTCHNSVHPTPCQPNKKTLTVNLGRVCSMRRSKSTDLFFEEAKNPILSVEAIVPSGRISYGSQSSNPYSNPDVSQQWGVLSAENRSKERFLIASFDLKGVDLIESKQKRKLTLDLKELKRKLGRDWFRAAVVASVCDDPNHDGSCYATPKSSLLSVVPGVFKANRIPSQVGLDIWSGRGLSSSTDGESCDKQYSPIVLDLTGEGIFLTGPEEGLKFDLNADGNEIYTGWIKGSNNAFLVRDINQNGRIDDGSELFGSATRLSNGKKAPNGFEALKDLDSNHDGLLTSFDREWKNLRLWFDRNFDGLSQRSEMDRLDQYQIKSISLNYIEMLEMDSYGNQTRERSTYVRRVRGRDKPLLAVDIWFRTLLEQ